MSYKGLLHLVASAITFSIMGVASAHADVILVSEMESHFRADTFALPLELGLLDLARKMADPQCDYEIDLTDSVLMANSNGLPLSVARQDDIAEGLPVYRIDYIERNDAYLANGPTGKVKAQIMVAVGEACDKAVSNILAEIEAGKE